MRANIRLRLSRLSPLGVLALLDNVVAKLTGNALFPTPPMSLADMGSLADALRTAIEDATGGGVNARKLRDKKVAETQSVLRVTADYVRAHCDGDAAKLSSSGFELAKFPLPLGFVGVAQNVRAAATDVAGEVRLLWGGATGARMFRVQQASMDPAAGPVDWTTIAQVSRQRHTVEKLTSFTAYWFRVIALGIDSEGLPSDVVMGRPA
jgi:hypothetical protein